MATDNLCEHSWYFWLPFPVPGVFRTRPASHLPRIASQGPAASKGLCSTGQGTLDLRRLPLQGAGGAGGGGESPLCAHGNSIPQQMPLSAVQSKQALQILKVPHCLLCILGWDSGSFASGRVPTDQWPCGWAASHSGPSPEHQEGYFTKLVSPSSFPGGLQPCLEHLKEAFATVKSWRNGWRLQALGFSVPNAAASGVSWKQVGFCLGPLPRVPDHDER